MTEVDVGDPPAVVAAAQGDSWAFARDVADEVDVPGVRRPDARPIDPRSALF